MGPKDGYTEGEKSFLEFLDSWRQVEYRPNPERQANLECCKALVRELYEDYDLEVWDREVPGGRQFDLRFFGPFFPYGANRLLGELIARSNAFRTLADPEKESCYLILSVIVYEQDRIRNGKPLEGIL